MFRKFSKILLVFSAIISIIFTTISPVSALETGDITMQATPAEQDLTLSPNSQADGSFEISNIGRLPFSFTVSSRPYQALNLDYDPDFTTESDYTKLYNWLSFPRTEYYLEPGASTTVDYHVSVPSDAPGGGQYAAIIVETKDSKDPDATMRTISQLAILLYAQVAGETRLGGSLVEQNLPSFLLGSPFSSTVVVENTGNIDFSFTHSLAIRDFFTNQEVFSPDATDLVGQPIGTLEPLILPGSQRISRITWDGAPALGLFRAVSTVEVLGESSTIERVVFLCPVWLATIALVLVGLMVLWLILRIRKRRQDRPQIV